MSLDFILEISIGANLERRSSVILGDLVMISFALLLVNESSNTFK